MSVRHNNRAWGRLLFGEWVAWYGIGDDAIPIAGFASIGGVVEAFVVGAIGIGGAVGIDGHARREADCLAAVQFPDLVATDGCDQFFAAIECPQDRRSDLGRIDRHRGCRFRRYNSCCRRRSRGGGVLLGRVAGECEQQDCGQKQHSTFHSWRIEIQDDPYKTLERLKIHKPARDQLKF